VMRKRKAPTLPPSCSLCRPDESRRIEADTAHLADLADFERGIVGSFHRRSEPLGLIRPHNICHMPYAAYRGVDLFLESL
jgi:hypothetical protein